MVPQDLLDLFGHALQVTESTASNFAGIVLPPLDGEELRDKLSECQAIAIGRWAAAGLQVRPFVLVAEQRRLRV